RQDGYHFTDLSPSGNTLTVNSKLGFTHLDTRSVLVHTARFGKWRGVRLVTDHRSLDKLIEERDRKVYEDHIGAAAARHVLLQTDKGNCYVIFRKDRRKGWPLFASLLYVSNAEAFRRSISHFSRHLLFSGGIP